MKKNSYASQLSLALNDIMLGLKYTPSWLWISWNDIKQKYKRSVLGPFWITLSLAITVCFMGLLYSKLFKIDIKEYLPFLSSGLINWTLISSIMLEGSTIFIINESLMKQVYLPFSFHVFRMLSRNIIIWLHNVVVLIIVKIIFLAPIDFNIFWLLVSLPILCLFGFGVSVLLGMFTVRFRDLQQVINSLVQLLFFVTPVIWVAKTLGSNIWVLKYNIFYYFLELLRQPFIRINVFSNGVLLVSLVTTFVTLFFSVLVFAKYRSKISYWI